MLGGCGIAGLSNRRSSTAEEALNDAWRWRFQEHFRRISGASQGAIAIAIAIAAQEPRSRIMSLEILMPQVSTSQLRKESARDLHHNPGNVPLDATFKVSPSPNYNNSG